jgi:hypothetical protein
MNNTGFLSIAQNSDTDYFRLCYFQFLYLKKVMPDVPYTVIVDRTTYKDIPEKCKTQLHKIVVLENDYAINENWKFSNEPQVYDLTPFENTIKIESDLLITRDISHWIPALDRKDIVFAYGCKNFLQQKTENKFYRHFFIDNNLPDIYNGLMYFKKSRLSERFFKLAQDIFLNWNILSNNFINSVNVGATTDVVYAITAKILGIENFIIPNLDFWNFVHMKKRINNWAFNDWTDIVITEFDEKIFRIANINQYYPVHYHDKNLITDDLINQYEK